ncbi:MAG: C25 family cysteine peptidase [Bacteroidales bacterium]|nr:C25 family cysteine peptidase [Bacteroidales bacterium]
MKKLSLTFILSMVCIFAMAQTVEMSYHFGQPNVTHIMGYDQIQFKGCMQSALAGQPSLPWQSVSLMLPQGTEAESIEVELSDFVEMDGNFSLYPYQPARTYSNPERTQFVKDEAIYNSKAIYPTQSYGEVSTYYMNGIGFAFSAISPVQYNPAEGKVMYATTANVKVKVTASKKDNSNMLWLNANNVNNAKRLAQNPEMLQSYNAKGRTASGYELLIIAKQQWIDQFEEYRNFYLARGLRSQIVAVEDIYSSMTGVDNPEKIRNYIIQEYENNGIIMVNLAGDVPDIPYRGFYCDVLSGGSHQTDNDIPSDLYYAALDGNWNDNGNNRWGEIGEDDLLPELGIGRMCFDTQSELNNIMHKTLTYQSEPVLGEFHNIILGGEHLYDGPETNGSQYLELLIGERDDNGYTTIGIPENYEFTRLYEEEGNWSGSRLRNAINEGKGYVHHDGHANTNYVAGWYNNDITDNNFSAANGIDHNYTFFHTSGCICGDFTDNCILEKMTQIANFAVATFGNSRYGWFNEGQTEGPAAHLHRETEDAFFHERIPYAGLAMREAKCQTAPWVNAPGQWEENALRWNFYDLNIMGDVAVSPWHDEPFTPEVDYTSELLVGIANTTVTVTDGNGNGLFNFRCSLFHGEDLIGTANTDENGVAEITFAEPIDFVGEMSLIITGCDAWPTTLPVITLPGNCAYVIFNDFVVNDENGQADFGETFGLNMQFKNVGQVDAANITATISTDSEYVTIIDGTETISSIDGGATLDIENAFSVTISDAVPNDTQTQFILTCTDGTDTWQSKFNMTLHAPDFAIAEIVVDDSEGNNNGCIEPGETVTLHINGINNGGSMAPSTTMHILPPDEVAAIQTTFNIGNVEADGTFDADFTFTVADDAELGVAYNFIITVTSGNYELEYSEVLPLGNVTEGFETGDFSSFDWNLNGYTNPWRVVSENPFEGDYCAKSGNINGNQKVELSIEITTAMNTEISFYKKVSSEANYDKLFFYIDGQEKGNWSGEVAWSQETYAIAAGTHELKWSYSKDVAMDSGSDCAWIDNVVFPPTTIITNVEESVSSTAIYPNPNKGNFSIDLPNEICEIAIYNSLGQMVYQAQGNGLTEINLEGIEKGMYFVSIKSNSATMTQKMIVE